MTISSRTPEGTPHRCPVCRHKVRVEPPLFFGDAPCPHCGTLLWFVQVGGDLRFFDWAETVEFRERFIEAVAGLAKLNADSLDLMELVLALEEQDEDAGQ